MMIIKSIYPINILLLIFLANGLRAQIDVYPYLQNFEFNPSIDWVTLAVGPDCSTEWYTTSGPANNSTGASTANSGSSYLTASYDGCTGTMEKIIVSPTYDFTDLASPKFTFFYHLYGADIGTLELEISTDGGAIWDQVLWDISGQQQSQASDPWTEVEVDLSPYAGQSVLLRFVGNNNGELSAFSLDQFRVFDADNDILNGQADAIYEYDAAGNRVKRYYVVEEMAQSEEPPAELRSSTIDFNPIYRVYPNPTTYRIHVESEKSKTSFMTSLLDDKGGVLQKFQMTDGILQIDMSRYPVGTYIIAIDDGEKVVSKKIIKL